MKYEELNPEQVARIKRVIRVFDGLADISDVFLSGMLINISLIAFGLNGPRWFNDNRWNDVVKIYDVAKEEMGNGT